MTRLSLVSALGWFAVAGLTLSAPEVSAQEIVLTADASGLCPDFDSGTGRQLRYRAGLTFVPDRDIELRQNTTPFSDLVSRVLERDFEPARIYASFQRPDGKRLLFAQFPSESAGFCAWIPQEAVFMSECLYADGGGFNGRGMRLGPRRLRAAEVDNRTGATCQVESEALGLIAKVTLHNINQEQSELDQGLQVFKTPGVPLIEASGQSRKLKVADIFHVFDQQLIRERNPATGEQIYAAYYLVGRAQQQNSIAISDQFSIEGWVHENDIYNWNTRFSAFWAGTGEARGYKEPFLLITDPEKWTMQEPPSFVENPDRVSASFPLVSEENTSEPVEKRLVQLVVPGGNCAPDATKDDDCLTARQLQEKQRELVENLESMNRVDVMFLLDKSRSMDEYFKAISDILPQVVDKMQADARGSGQTAPSLRVAVATYGDYTGGVSSIRSVDYRTIVRFADISSASARSRFLDGLKRELEREPKDAEKDLREATFAAIARAAQDKNWRPEAGFRVIVHIGDHGNREFGKTSEETGDDGRRVSNLVEKVSPGDAIRDLCAKNISYAPVAVQGTKYDRAVSGAFVRQATLLANAATGRCVGNFLPVRMTYSGASAESSASRNERIRQGIEFVAFEPQRQAAAVREQIRCLENNGGDCFAETEIAANSSGGDPWAGVIRRGLREDAGFSEKQLRNLYEQAQPSVALYFPVQKYGQELFNYSIAATVSDLTALQQVYTEICDLSSNAAIGPIEMRAALIELIGTASGDEFSGVETAREFLNRIAQFPARHLGDNRQQINFLAQGWDEIMELLEIGTIQERVAYAKAICRTSLLIRQVRNGKRFDLDQMEFIEDDGDGFGFWDVADGARRDYKWDVASLNGVKLFHVPLEYFTHSD